MSYYAVGGGNVAAASVTEEDYERAYAAGTASKTPFTLSPSGKRQCPGGWKRDEYSAGDWKQVWCLPPEGGSGSSVKIPAAAVLGALFLVFVLTR